MIPVIKIEGARWLQFVEIQAATIFFAKKLKGFQRKRVYLRIELEKGLMKGKHKCKAYAHQNSRTGYAIVIDSKLKPLAMLGSLAHEMIHVNQWLTGKMVDIQNRYRVQWGSRVYKMPMKYSKHPWEREAHRMEGRLAQSFVDFYTSGWRKK